MIKITDADRARAESVSRMLRRTITPEMVALAESRAQATGKTSLPRILDAERELAGRATVATITAPAPAQKETTTMNTTTAQTECENYVREQQIAAGASAHEADAAARRAGERFAARASAPATTTTGAPAAPEQDAELTRELDRLRLTPEDFAKFGPKDGSLTSEHAGNYGARR